MAQTSWDANKETITDIRQTLSQDLQIPILNADMVPSWSDDNYFDTEWHLTAAAKQQRTEGLVESIKRYQAGSGSGITPTIPMATKPTETQRY